MFRYMHLESVNTTIPNLSDIKLRIALTLVYITQLKIDALLCVNGKGYNHYKNNLLITFPTTYPRGFVAKTTAVQ